MIAIGEREVAGRRRAELGPLRRPAPSERRVRGQRDAGRPSLEGDTSEPGSRELGSPGVTDLNRAEQSKARMLSRRRATG